MPIPIFILRIFIAIRNRKINKNQGSCKVDTLKTVISNDKKDQNRLYKERAKNERKYKIDQPFCEK